MEDAVVVSILVGIDRSPSPNVVHWSPLERTRRSVLVDNVAGTWTRP